MKFYAFETANGDRFGLSRQRFGCSPLRHQLEEADAYARENKLKLIERTDSTSTLLRDYTEAALSGWTEIDTSTD